MGRRQHKGVRRHHRRHIDNAVPLTSISEGEKATVVCAIGGRGLVRRLAEMGLTPGTKIKVLRKGILGGPVQIEVRGVSLALGHGVASKIFVKTRNAAEANG